VRTEVLALVALLAGCFPVDEATNQGASEPGRVDREPQPSAPEGPPPPAPTAEPAQGTNGVPGTNGVHGTDGAHGTNGVQGTNGAQTGQTGQQPGQPGTGQGPAVDAREAEGRVLARVHQEHVHEIALARLAVERSKNAEVKALAERLRDEHVRADDALTALARAEGIVLQQPSEADNTAQTEMVTRLGGMQGAAFDREYVRVIADAHERSIAEVEAALVSAQDPEVRQYLEGLLPAFRKHLDESRQIRPKLGGA
jgi:putative membrane protein